MTRFSTLDALNDDLSNAFSIQRPLRHTTPIVIASPHSGRNYPERFLQQSCLDLNTLRRCEDAMVDALFSFAPHEGVPLLTAHFPRVYCDANRGERELDPSMFLGPLPKCTLTDKVRAGLGMIPRVAREGKSIYRERLPSIEATHRLKTCWNPYHTALRGLIKETTERFGICVLIDAHSMPSFSRYALPDIVLGNCHSTSCASSITLGLQKDFRALGYDVVLNRPYAGGYVTSHYGVPDRNVHTIQIEINRKLYMDEQSLNLLATFSTLQGHLRKVVENLTKMLRS